MKEKVLVYLKINSNDEEEMNWEEKRAIEYCFDNDMEIVKIIKDYEDENTLEDICSYVSDKSNGIYNLVTNRFDMISKDIAKVYDYYKYLKDYCYCNLITLTHGNQFHFDIKLEKGAINE